jgi:hypothetical protein
MGGVCLGEGKRGAFGVSVQVSRRLRSSFAGAGRDSALPKPLRGAIVTVETAGNLANVGLFAITLQRGEFNRGTHSFARHSPINGSLVFECRAALSRVVHMLAS